MHVALYRIILALSLVFEAISGASLLLAPYEGVLAESDGVAAVVVRGMSNDAGVLALFSAWCCGLALRWLPKHPGHSATLAIGIGVAMIATGMLRVIEGSSLALLVDVGRGALLLAVVGMMSRRRGG